MASPPRIETGLPGIRQRRQETQEWAARMGSCAPATPSHSPVAWIPSCCGVRARQQALASRMQPANAASMTPPGLASWQTQPMDAKLTRLISSNLQLRVQSLTGHPWGSEAVTSEDSLLPFKPEPRKEKSNQRSRCSLPSWAGAWQKGSGL